MTFAFRHYLLALLIVSSPALSDQESTKEVIRWLNWPVTAYPFKSIDSGALVPSQHKRFLVEAERDVRIGLRSDGIVVWKYVDSEAQSLDNRDKDPKLWEAH